jgi:hypothetical protein
MDGSLDQNTFMVKPLNRGYDNSYHSIEAHRYMDSND